jgi:hypothetical protein
MKKYLLFVLPALMLSLSCLSQSYEGTTEYNKKKQTAFIIDYDYSTEAVENAIIKKMADLGYKAKEEKGMFNKDKGFIVFKNAFITDISSSSMDYIIKVERKSRKESDASTVYMVLNKDGENAVSSMESFDIGRAKTFLNNLLPEIEEAGLELRIKGQEDVVVKSDKKFKSLQDDKIEMEKKIKKLQEDLEKNIKDQELQQKDIENQRQALDILKGKRRSS